MLPFLSSLLLPKVLFDQVSVKPVGAMGLPAPSWLPPVSSCPGWLDPAGCEFEWRELPARMLRCERLITRCCYAV